MAPKTSRITNEKFPNLSPAEVTSIQTLPLFSARVLREILLGLYAEPGFSDVGTDDIAEKLKCKRMDVNGALKRLKASNLAFAEEMDGNGRKTAFLFSDLHSGLEGAARRSQGLVAVEMRIAHLDAISGRVMPLAEPVMAEKKLPQVPLTVDYEGQLRSALSVLPRAVVDRVLGDYFSNNARGAQ